MSLPDSTDPGRGVVVHKPKADIYTVLLGIALLSILMAIMFLCMELSRYNWDVKAPAQSRRIHAGRQFAGDGPPYSLAVIP